MLSSDKQAKESHDGTSQKTMVPIQQQQQHLQSQIATTQSLTQHHNNIILVRGSRNENGQIILQNSHELLNLLNDEDKPILLQHPRFKTSKQQSEGAILLHPTIKSTHNDGPVLLQSANVKKSTTLPEGSIIVQQRLNKNGTADGPILLQTLKRLDKSQSILVFRNANTSTASASLTSNSSTSRIIHLTDDADEMKPEPVPVPKAINTPLGSGEYTKQFFYIFFPLHRKQMFFLNVYTVHDINYKHRKTFYLLKRKKKTIGIINYVKTIFL